MLKPSINQVMWFVGAGNFVRVCGEVTITEVGRKWARITGAFKGRIALDTLMADGAGYSSPGRCYASKQEWLNQDGPRHAWQALSSSMPTACPADLSYETIVQAAKMLGVDIDLLAKSGA